MTPADSYWHADVSSLSVHAQSAAWISSIGATAGLKADFGAGIWNGGPIGIPYTTVPGNQARVPVSFGYADEDDAGPYPVPSNAPIEGENSSTGDRHVLIVDRDACRLWKLLPSAYPHNGGALWTAGSGATWDLNSDAMRPLGWTSGDAAGLPILPAQLTAYLTDGLWLRLAGHANQRMAELVAELEPLSPYGVRLQERADVNMAFVDLPAPAIEAASADLLFYRMGQTSVRLVTSWQTTAEDVAEAGARFREAVLARAD